MPEHAGTQESPIAGNVYAIEASTQSDIHGKCHLHQSWLWCSKAPKNMANMMVYLVYLSESLNLHSP